MQYPQSTSSQLRSNGRSSTHRIHTTRQAPETFMQPYGTTNYPSNNRPQRLASQFSPQPQPYLPLWTPTLESQFQENNIIPPTWVRSEGGPTPQAPGVTDHMIHDAHHWRDLSGLPQTRLRSPTMAPPGHLRAGTITDPQVLAHIRSASVTNKSQITNAGHCVSSSKPNTNGTFEMEKIKKTNRNREYRYLDLLSDQDVSTRIEGGRLHPAKSPTYRQTLMWVQDTRTALPRDIDLYVQSNGNTVTTALRDRVQAQIKREKYARELVSRMKKTGKTSGRVRGLQRGSNRERLIREAASRYANCSGDEDMIVCYPKLCAAVYTNDDTAREVQERLMELAYEEDKKSRQTLQGE